ncbi:MAG: TRAP transporter small permease [Planctomycetota bacterium]|jgi:TRAP-type C4-dicarboxylate transport system permease small subunit|nr:TRAP transporter small permease [Planctomycetota bacterium]
MRTLLTLLRRAERPISFFLDLTSVGILAALVIIIFQEVVMRYVFSSPGKWSEELAIAMLIWFGYLGIAVGYRDNRHLSLTFFSDWLPAAGQKILLVFSDLVVLAFCLLMAWQGVKVAKLDAINTMPATGIAMSWVSIVLTVAGCAMILEGAIRILAHLFPEAPQGSLVAGASE